MKKIVDGSPGLEFKPLCSFEMLPKMTLIHTYTFVFQSYLSKSVIPNTLLTSYFISITLLELAGTLALSSYSPLVEILLLFQNTVATAQT